MSNPVATVRDVQVIMSSTPDEGELVEALTVGLTRFTQALVRNQIRRALRFGLERDVIMESRDQIDEKLSDMAPCQDDQCSHACDWHALLADRDRLERKYDYLTKMLGGRQ